MKRSRFKRRADHRDPEGTGSGDGYGGCVPPSWGQLSHVLQVEVEVRWAGGVRGPSAAGTLIAFQKFTRNNIAGHSIFAWGFLEARIRVGNCGHSDSPFDQSE